MYFDMNDMATVGGQEEKTQPKVRRYVQHVCVGKLFNFTCAKTTRKCVGGFALCVPCRHFIKIQGNKDIISAACSQKKMLLASKMAGNKRTTCGTCRDRIKGHDKRCHSCRVKEGLLL